MAVKKKAAMKAKKVKKPMSRKAAPKARAAKSPARRRVATAAKMETANSNFPSSPITAKQSKAQIYNELATMTGMAKSEVKQFFSALRNVVERHLKTKGSGEFVIPNLGVKVRRIHKAATKARMGRNPFTGEEIQIPAKPARKSVKASALKGLKEVLMG